MSKSTPDKLAIHGGTPVRGEAMPARIAFGEAEAAMLGECIEHYRKQGLDPGYEGHYEERYCTAFSEYMGGGYTDAVSSGTAGIFVGLKALDLTPGSEIITSPVTDSGPVCSIVLQGHVPVVADAEPNSYNMGVEQFLERITPRTSCLLLTHAAGEPVAVDEMVEEAHKHGIKVLEDCSQAHGALCKDEKIGRFGDIAAFSTMYRKNLAAGGSSGLVYTTDKDLHMLALSHADRGKPVWKKNELDLRNPAFAAFPAINFNSDEMRCAIGLASLGRLQETVERRLDFLENLVAAMAEKCQICTPYNFHRGFSPFYFPIFVDTDHISCTKIEFAQAVAAEGIGLGDHYGCLVSTWPWLEEYLSDDFKSENALSTQARSFNLYVNENYTEREVEDVVNALVKVEQHFTAN